MDGTEHLKCDHLTSLHFKELTIHSNTCLRTLIAKTALNAHNMKLRLTKS